MTDKEQIIIDGVDVSGCSALCCGNACFLSQHYSFTEPKYKPFCVDNPTCDHKQLVRKMQEYEELKSESFTREELITLQEKDIERYNRVFEEIEEIVQTIIETNKVYPLQDNLFKILVIINKAKEKEG